MLQYKSCHVTMIHQLSFACHNTLRSHHIVSFHFPKNYNKDANFSKFCLQRKMVLVLWQLRFSQSWWFMSQSSGLWCCVVMW